MAKRRPPLSNAVDAFVRAHYCVWGPDGQEDVGRLERTRAAVRAANPKHPQRRLTAKPNVEGVPPLRAMLTEIEQVPKLVRRLLPKIERNPRQHALSFLDPLRLANELGIAVTPRIARALRWSWRAVVPFEVPTDFDTPERLAAYSKLRWKPKL